MPGYLKGRITSCIQEHVSDQNIKIKQDCFLGEVKRYYCGKFNLSSNNLKFMINGHFIKYDDTPLYLELEDDFEIGVYYGLGFGCLLFVLLLCFIVIEL